MYAFPPWVGKGRDEARSGTSVDPSLPPTCLYATSPSFVRLGIAKLYDSYESDGSIDLRPRVPEEILSTPPRCSVPAPRTETTKEPAGTAEGPSDEMVEVFDEARVVSDRAPAGEAEAVEATGEMAGSDAGVGRRDEDAFACVDQSGDRAGNPVASSVFWRVCRLLIELAVAQAKVPAQVGEDDLLQKLAAGEAANMAKFAASEAALSALDQAIQTHGGNGLSHEYGLSELWFVTRLMRTAPVSR